MYPQYITSEAIIAYVRAKNASKSNHIQTLYQLCDSRVEAIEFSVEEASAVTNKAIMDLKKGVLISFINRNGRIIIPTGQDFIQVNDTVMIITTQTGFNTILDILE